MPVYLLSAKQAAARLAGSPYYGYGNAPGFLGNTNRGVARLLIRTGNEDYYLQGEITADRRINSYFPNLYGGIVPLQETFVRINDAFGLLDRFVDGEVYQLMSRPFARAIDREATPGGLSAAILPLPANHEEYFRAIGDKSRNMVRKPMKAGYRIALFEKNQYLEDIYAIHTSLDVRQGQPLAEHYKQKLYANYNGRRSWELITEEWWGAFTPEGRLVGYVYLPGSNGEYLTSRIMGHGDFLKMGIMNALVDAIVNAHAGERGHVMYGMYEHGTDGLRRFKDSMGFAPVPCVRFQFGSGARVGKLAVGALGMINQANIRTGLRNASKSYPKLRGALLQTRAKLQRMRAKKS